MACISKSVTVDVDIDVEDVIDELTDEQLAELGLLRIESTSEPDELRAAIYNAAQSGDCAAMVRAIEVMAWELDGKFLVTRLAA